MVERTVVKGIESGDGDGVEIGGLPFLSDVYLKTLASENLLEVVPVGLLCRCVQFLVPYVGLVRKNWLINICSRLTHT